MLSLQRPGLLFLSGVDFVKAMQDLRHLFKVRQPESQMVEVVIYVSSDLLTTCSALAQLGNCEAQHCFVYRCANKKKLGYSSASLDREEQDEHNGVEFMSNR